MIDFPHNVIGEQAELTAETLVRTKYSQPLWPDLKMISLGLFLQEAGDNQQYCWRNLFSCINLLRILNKLTKWKHSRTMVCVTGSLSNPLCKIENIH